MLLALVIVFITIPILEILIFIQISNLIGALVTIMLVVLTAGFGIWLLRLQGLATLSQLRHKLRQGQIPGQELLEGIILLVGGALLLTPGFATDIFGFLCLLPASRKPAAKYLLSYLLLRYSTKHGSFFGSTNQAGNSDHGTHSIIIEGEFKEQTSISETPKEKPR